MGASVLDNSMDFRPVVLIPVYDHEAAIETTLKNILEYDCPVLLVDDGSKPSCHAVLVELSEKYSDRVTLLVLAKNSGKGFAVKTGFRALLEGGYSHAIQVDADGQHDASDMLAFIDAARKNPEALVAGYPKYDESVPKLRYYGRYLTHVWVWINTLSFSIRDSMCGFRMYPLAAIVQQFEEEKCGDRMDFDTEAIVRWSWRDGRIINVPTQVHYPIDGVSHFNMWHDNFLITLMHTRLFLGMLRRLPVLLWRKLNG